MGTMEFRFKEGKDINAMVLQVSLDVLNLGCWLVLVIKSPFLQFKEDSVHPCWPFLLPYLMCAAIFGV